MTLFEKFKWAFGPNKISMLEQYVLSKNPQTIADVEHWARMYDLRSEFVDTYKRVTNVG